MIVKSVRTFMGTSAERTAVGVLTYLPGDVFVETDTGDVYIQDSTQWVKMAVDGSLYLLLTGGTLTGQLTVGESGDDVTQIIVLGKTIRIQNDNVASTAQFQLVNDAQTFSFALSGALSNAFLIYDNTAGATRMRIDSNGNIAFGSSAVANSSTKVEFQGTSGAVLLPRLTTTQRNALTAVNGMIIYNSTNNRLEGYENGAWVDL